MKNYLHTLPYFLLLLSVFSVPPKIFAQCTCSSGDAATPLSYYYKLDTTDVPVSNISFPKFNPTMGILSCVTLNDTTSLVTVSGVRNTASSDVTYEFLLNVTNKITGPGIAITQSATRDYGPTLLTLYGTPGDTTSYGPDTLFKNKVHQSSSSSVVSYLGGSGTINIEYKVNGGGIATDGGLNYRYQIHSKYWGGFRLTYYWCPNAVLATNIKNFSAIKKDKNILLKWITDNKTPGITYEIEYSQDGHTFSGTGQADTDDMSGNSTQHEFQYVPGSSTSTKLYFRIKQTDALGKVTYSVVRMVNTNENSAAGFVIYPNPVSQKVSMQFDRSMNGNYSIQVTSLAGQILYSRNIKLNNSDNLQFQLNNPPASGMYYLKITDVKTKLSHSSKLIIRR